MKSIKEFLTVLENTPGKNDKKDLLEANKNDPVLKRVFQYGLDDSIFTGIKAIPEYTPGTVTRDISTALDDMEVLYKGVLTGNAARSHLSDILSSVNEDDADVITRLVRKKLNVGMSAKSANTVYGKDFIPVEPYMRCDLLNSKTILNITSFQKLGYAYSECKMDGQYLNIIVRGNNVTAMSRNGKEYDFLGVLDHDLIYLAQQFSTDPRFSDGIVFMGEGLVLDEYGNVLPRTTGNGIIQKAGKGTITEDEAENVSVTLWDVVPFTAYRSGIWNVHRSERRTMLETAIDKIYSKHVRMVEYRKVHSIEEALDYNSELMALEHEGTVLKCEFGIWKSHTSPKQLKVKMVMEIDMKIVGFIEGQDKRKGALGSLMLSSEDGKVITNCGTGFKEKDAEWTVFSIWANRDKLLNTICTVKTNGLIKDRDRTDDVQSLFLPSFLEFRPDKDTADDLPRINKIVESAIEVLKENLKRELLKG